MSDVAPDKEFWDLADGFVALANQQCDAVRAGKVSAALLYSAARFNAFVAASAAKSPQEFSAEKEESAAYFVKQFEKMLRENFADYEAHFADYISNKG